MKTNILNEIPENIEKVLADLLKGNVVGLPTETVYGLAANAYNELAITKIFKAKERPHFDPLIVHHCLTDLENPTNTIRKLHERKIIQKNLISLKEQNIICKLIKNFWPGPMTLILPRGPKIPDMVTSGLSTVALRHPSHPLMQKIIQKLDLPLAAPSANHFGKISPTCAEDVHKELEGKISFILDGGPCQHGLESTIIQIQNDKVFILRHGSLSKENLEDCLDQTVYSKKAKIDENVQLKAPGTLASHYSPRKKLKLIPSFLDKEILKEYKDKNVGILLFQGNQQKQKEMMKRFNSSNVLILSEKGSLEEAARNLFKFLRALDESNCELIICENFSLKQGLAWAIQDRLERASYKN